MSKTSPELPAKFWVTRTGRKLLLPTAEEDRRITEAAMSDPEAQPLTDEQLAAIVPIRLTRGRPRLESTKVLLSVRYSPEVVKYFKGTGPGWQARMDEVLREYISKRLTHETNAR